MAGKITTILTQREAETYCKQGLHKEALKLYRKLLSSTPNIDPALRKAVEHKINEICSTLESDAALQLRQLSNSDVVRIKQGWGKRATESEVLVCAQTFFRMGRFREAIDELTELLSRGRTTKSVIMLLAECLINLHRPPDVAKKIEALGWNIFDTPQKRFRFYVQLVEAMLILKKPGYAQSLLEHLQDCPAFGKDASRRLRAIAAKIAQQHPPTKDVAEVKKEASSKQALAPGQKSIIAQSYKPPPEQRRNRSLLRRLLHLFNRT
jgi:tetratricopeptide (TPR) repeat protein